MTSKSLLVTRPEHDIATRYLARWSEPVLKEAGRKGVRVVDLHKKKANSSRVRGVLKKRSPRLVFLNGHGSDEVVTGHDNEVILDEGDREVVEGKIFFARACKSAKKLGFALVANGAAVYLGYEEDFVFLLNENKASRPLEDRTAALFLEPSNHVVIALLKGHSAREANERSRRLYGANIARLLTQEGSEDYDAVKLLYWDMVHQVVCGDENAAF